MLHSQCPIHSLLHEQLNNNIQTYRHSSTFFYDYRQDLVFTYDDQEERNSLPFTLSEDVKKYFDSASTVLSSVD